MTVKTPVGILGWFDEEFAEHERTMKWPERTVEAPEKPPGFSLDGPGHPAPSSPSPEEEALRKETTEALRELWRLHGRWEAAREVRTEFAREGGRTSGQARRAKPWRAHATELAKIACAKDTSASIETTATEIAAGWKRKNLKCPGHRTLEKLVSELRADGTLPQRTGSLRK